MVYSNKFVMCILVNGQIAKEFPNGTTLIPFGSEYTIRFRNKNSRKAVVKFSIDGEDAGGQGYIIPANDHIDIKRYAHKDVAFKFVDLNSQEAIDFGKNGDNKDRIKGVIEAIFYLEKEIIKCYTYNNSPTVYWQNASPRRTKGFGFSNPTHGEITATCDSYELPSGCVLCSAGPGVSSPKVSDGATVEGSQTGQYFNYQHINLENDYVAVKTCLQGYVSETNDKDYWIPKRAEKLEEENKKLKLEITEKLKLEALEKENKRLKEELEKLKNG